MNNRCRFCILLTFIILELWVTGCQPGTKSVKSELPQIIKQEGRTAIQVQTNLKEQLLAEYNGIQPQQWGERTSGVVFGLDTGDKVLALTFDACGGSANSNGYDADLIDYLDKKEIPATLFISGRWIDANPELFLKLANNGLFEIGNHGLNHLPCSVNGRSAYHIRGTSSISEVINEIDANGKKIRSLTGREPRFYRSGTNYYDEVAVDIAGDLNYKIVSYSVLGDAGATFSRFQVKKALLGAQAGSIIIFHFNHPEGETAEGIMDAIPLLQKNGFKFVRLSDYTLKESP